MVWASVYVLHVYLNVLDDETYTACSSFCVVFSAFVA